MSQLSQKMCSGREWEQIKWGFIKTFLLKFSFNLIIGFTGLTFEL